MIFAGASREGADCGGPDGVLAHSPISAFLDFSISRFLNF